MPSPVRHADRRHRNDQPVEELDALALTENAGLGHPVVFGDRKRAGREFDGHITHGGYLFRMSNSRTRIFLPYACCTWAIHACGTQE